MADAPPPVPPDEPVPPEGAAEAQAAGEAAALRATAARFARTTEELQKRVHETERLLAKAERTQAHAERTRHELHARLSDAEALTHEHHVHADHGNRLLGTKRPDQGFDELPAAPPDESSPDDA